MAKLSEAQRSILTDLCNKVRYPDGWATAQWIAESCGYYYQTEWASSKLPGLIKRGFIERGIRGYYCATEAGRLALQPQGDIPEGNRE